MSKVKKEIASEDTTPQPTLKEVAVVAPQTTALTVEEGAEDEVLISMIKLPRLSLQQKMSKPVEAELAKVGDLFENLQNTVVCPKDKPFYFIPLKLRNVITTYEVVQTSSGVKKEFRGSVPRTVKNEKLEWDQVIDGKPHKCLPETIVYMLNAADLEEGNIVLPYVFTFRGASMPKGGKSIYTQKILLDQSGLKFYKFKFKMTNEKVQKDDNTFQVANVEMTKEKLDPKFNDICEKWLLTLSNMNNVEVTEDDVDADLGASKPQATVKEQF